MANLRFIVSLTTKDNDYQLDQAAASQATAQKVGVDAQILNADNDAITQSTQLLKEIQSDAAMRPHAIIFEPVGGTAFPQVAQAAVSAKIGWAALNREADYIPKLRKTSQVPVFSSSSDHKEIGRIQGRQFAALLPKGGCVLYMPKTGQAWVPGGRLAATVVVPTNAEQAIFMLAEALKTGKDVAERTFTEPESLPEIEKLAARDEKVAPTV
jgi:ABC-type sugar transport system substrate-binding protein